ncbi:unnamed protein product [Rotaria sp. Silwood2]|nr:unnamed protein product [Rotaria sp. Silwood2]
MNITETIPTAATTALTLKTSSQDAQASWYEFLSPTQVLTGQQQQPQEDDKEKKKKKCRDPEIHTELVQSNATLQQNQKQIKEDTNDEIQVHIPVDRVSQSTQHKDKHHDSPVNESIKRERNEISTKAPSNTIDKSLSQLSLSQPSPKKQKTINNQVDQIEQVTTNGTSNKKNSKSKKQINHNNDDSYMPDYLKVKNRIFTQMLISSLGGADKIVKRLNTSEKINYIPQYAYLIHRLFYVQLQESQWKYYYDIGLKDNIWSGRVSKKWAAMTTSQALQHFGNQPLPQCMSEMNPPFNFTTMSAMITAVVRKGQHKLKQQFEYNKNMLKLNSTDHCLVQSVYDFKPNQQQIRSIRNLWKAIYNKKTNGRTN